MFKKMIVSVAVLTIFAAPVKAAAGADWNTAQNWQELDAAVLGKFGGASGKLTKAQIQNLRQFRISHAQIINFISTVFHISVDQIDTFLDQAGLEDIRKIVDNLLNKKVVTGADLLRIVRNKNFPKEEQEVATFIQNNRAAIEAFTRRAIAQEQQR